MSERTRRHQRAFVLARQGELFDGAEVLAVVAGGTNSHGTRYLVSYGCCGHQGEIGHYALTRPMGRLRRCRSCASREAQRSESVLTLKPLRSDGVVDGRGQFWPRLRMKRSGGAVA